MVERRDRRDDRAVSEFMATVLLAGLVVLMGGAVSAIVAADLSRASPPTATFSLAGIEPGDASLTVLYRSGERLPLSSFSLSLQRGAGAPAFVGSSTWTTPDAAALRPGDTLSFTISPSISPGDRVVVRIVHNASASLLAELTSRAATTSSGASALGNATLVSGLAPSGIVADGASASLLTVLVSHPAGASVVSSVEADLRNLTAAAGSAASLLSLNDAGHDGDPIGADGNWSALVRASPNTSVGTYNITINATDITGARAGSTWANLAISSSLQGLINLTGIGNITAVISNLSNVTNLTCYGCVVGNGSGSYEGTRIFAPTSQNVSNFKLRNWTYDRQDPNRLDGDALVARVIGNTYSWSFYIRFEYQSNLPTITRLEMWNANSTTVYLPTSSFVSMTNLELNLLDPTSAGFTCSTGCTTPMTYGNANIQGNPTFLIAWMRDETNNFQTDELGIYSVDSVIT